MPPGAVAEQEIAPAVAPVATSRLVEDDDPVQPLDRGVYTSPRFQAGGYTPSEFVSFCRDCGVLAEMVYPGGLCIPCARDLAPRTG